GLLRGRARSLAGHAGRGKVPASCRPRRDRPCRRRRPRYLQPLSRRRSAPATRQTTPRQQHAPVASAGASRAVKPPNGADSAPLTIDLCPLLRSKPRTGTGRRLCHITPPGSSRTKYYDCREGEGPVGAQTLPLVKADPTRFITCNGRLSGPGARGERVRSAAASY